MNYTHMKRPYKATCLQWDGTNTDAVIEMLTPFATATPYTYGKEPTSPVYLMIRFKEKLEGRADLYTMGIGEWVAQGENGDVKCYDDETFNVKYTRLTPPCAMHSQADLD